MAVRGKVGGTKGGGKESTGNFAISSVFLLIGPSLRLLACQMGSEAELGVGLALTLLWNSKARPQKKQRKRRKKLRP